ncbi:MAG: TonB-dependent receptor [Pseudomonadota bacterium]
MNKHQHKNWRFNRIALGVAMATTIYSGNSIAQQTSEDLEEVIVRAHPLSGEGLAQPFATLDGMALQRAQAASIGETLMGLPSVTSTSFGQAVGRPVIRGQQGARVKVMEDRIDTMDVSVSSPDHATTIDSFTAESIEVFMGPSTLVYGSGALGGVVDVHTGRIPHEVPEETSARFEGRAGDNGDRRTAAGRIDTGTGNFAFHVDGFYRDADDYEIPGFAESKQQRALEEMEEEDHDEGEEHSEEEEARDKLPGSYLETYGGAVGVSYVTDTGFVGLAVSRYESNYGLPGHAHEHEGEEEEHEEEHEDEHGEEEEEGNAELDLEQTRVDFEWGQELASPTFESLNLRIGYNDYEHVEFEPNGEAGTKFENEAWEGRFELVHSELSSVKGVVGLQAYHRDFSALGEEAFVEPVETTGAGLFYVAETSFNSLGVEGGLRAEQVEQDPDSGSSKDFTLWSASLGFIQPLTDTWNVTAQLDYSSRAPTAVELFADGPHLATQAFEIGDPNLDEEKAGNVSFGIHHQSERWLMSFNAYYTQFDGFIYEVETGEIEDGLPVFQFTQNDAEFYGADALIQWQAMTWNRGSLSFETSADAVRGKLDEGGEDDLPRIPPSRWSVGATLDWANFLAEIRYTRVSDQDDVAPNELPTDGYDDLQVHLAYAMDVGETNVEVFFNGTNLTDDEQRLHTSFIKDLAPQPGITLEAGIRIIL